MEPSDAAKLRELEAENNKLKKLLAEAHLDIHALMSVFSAKRESVKEMVEEQQLSERRACSVVGLSRDSYRDPPQPDQLTRDLGSVLLIFHTYAACSATNAFMICCAQSFLG